MCFALYFADYPYCELVDEEYDAHWLNDCTGTVSVCNGVCRGGCERPGHSVVFEDTGEIYTFHDRTCTVTDTRKTNITCPGKSSPCKASPGSSFSSVVDQIPAVLDIFHRICAYRPTTLETTQTSGVCSAVRLCTIENP